MKTLSDKMILCHNLENCGKGKCVRKVLLKEDVKEFIRRMMGRNCWCKDCVRAEAGDKLI